ncbi:MAG TPA: trypsin-like peptidase domain-containing protein [Candidatus Saccharimonadales bacterium]|nr:trypsin-like peptidase domain-containing protein [Candidatus Saccharimonadales bacterium]
MYIKGRNRGRQLPVLPVHPKKHHKPYRIRHIGLLVFGLTIVLLSAVGSGYLWGRSGEITVPESPAVVPDPIKEAPETISSSLGFSLKYDSAVFSAEGRTVDDQAVSERALGNNAELAELLLKPYGESVKGAEALSELLIRVEPDSVDLDRYARLNGYASGEQGLRDYFAPEADNFNVEELSRGEQAIGSVKFQRTVYRQVPRFGGDAKPVFSIVWTGLYDGKPVSIQLGNLIDNSQIPSIYGQIFDSLRFGGGNQKVLAAGTVEENADINRVSPAVVKVYHFVCGTLVINELNYGQDACDGGAGSGFLVSGDGYIATSGHVVVLDAADILVNELLSNPQLLKQFTTAAGLSAEQSSKSDVVASVLAEIYDLPKDKLRLENRREITFVALGNRPVAADSQAKVKKLFELADNDSLKRAEVLAVNYQPKDLLVIEQNTKDGFSASDVALIKVRADDTPYIRLADNIGLAQNAPVSLIGFPADADNQLTENDVIAPSVTTGTISSIRQANGSSSLLFQTDADASEGSSGGPAINADGQAFGLVTYRFKGGNETNAAKSYIRDIADFKDLVDSRNISLIVRSTTQDRWEAGLGLFAENRYSKAIIEFRQVQRLYPAHRLVRSYIAKAQQAIREGKDKKDPPYAAIVIIGTGFAGGAAALIASKLIIRHRKHHLAYKAHHLSNDQLVNPRG